MTEHYMIRGGQQGYDRLQILARAAWPDTADLLDRIGVRPGMDCLDLGCGSGDVTLRLAALVGPDGHVVGVDEATADAAIAAGLATPAEVESARASLAAFTEDPRTLIGNPRTFQVWSRRP